MEPNKLLEERIGRVRTAHLTLVLTCLVGLVMHPFVRSTLHEELASIRSMLHGLSVDDPDPPRGADRFDMMYLGYVSEQTDDYSPFKGTCFDLGASFGTECFTPVPVIDDFHRTSDQEINLEWHEVRHSLAKLLDFWDKYKYATCGGVLRPDTGSAYFVENGSWRTLRSAGEPSDAARAFGREDFWDCQADVNNPERPTVMDDVCGKKHWVGALVSDLTGDRWFVADTAKLQNCPEKAGSVGGFLTHTQTVRWSPVLDSKSNAPLVRALLSDLEALKARGVSSAQTPMQDLQRLDEFDALSKVEEEKSKSVKIFEVEIDIATAQRWLPELIIMLQFVIMILLRGIGEADTQSPSTPDNRWLWLSTVALFGSVMGLPALTGYRIAGWLYGSLLFLAGCGVMLSGSGYRKMRGICF
jgi:hypothetical protein